MDPLWCQERDCPFILRCTRGRPSCPQPTTTAILHPIVGFIYDGRLLYGRCATRACMPAALANHSFGRARGPDYTVIFFFHNTYPSPDSTLPGTRSRLRTTTAPVADNTDIPCPRTAGGVACWRTARQVGPSVCAHELVNISVAPRNEWQQRNLSWWYENI